MLTKIALIDVPPITIVFARLFIASVVMAIAMLWVGQKLMPMFAHWKWVIAAALTGNAMPFFLITWGQEKVDAGLTAILMAIMPLMTIVIAHFSVGDERLNLFKVIGFCFGLIGVIVLIGWDKLASLGGETIRQYSIVGGAFCYALHAIISKKLASMPRLAISTAILIASSLMLLPVSLLIDQPWNLSISNVSLGTLLMLGIFPTAIGTLMLFMIVGREGAGFLSPINFLVPVFGVLWAIAFLDEVLPTNAVFALVIILVGVAIARINSNSMEKTS